MPEIAVLQGRCYCFTKKFVLFFLVVACVAFLIYTASRLDLLDASILHKKTEEDVALRNATLMAVQNRRRLAEIIVSVQQEVNRLGGTVATINPEWHTKLAAVAEELDPRMSLVEKNYWDHSARLVEMGPAPLIPGRTRHVCPEVYYGNKYNHPYSQHGMEPEQCTYVPPFHSVLTAVLPATLWTSDVVNFVAKQIKQNYDIPIIAIVSSTKDIDHSISNIAIKQISKGYDEAEFMNEVLGNVTTPYILLGTAMVHFNNQSSLERLVRVIDELELVKVAGGSARDSQGLWIHGCLQQKMANYQAVYTMGYYYSKFECMYCDDLLTPFVTTVQLIKDIPFTKGLNGSVMYRDWFANVRLAGHLTMTCPDVMFYVNQHVTMSKEDWLKMATKWSLQTVNSYDDKVYNFDCESVKIGCGNPLGIIHSYLLPPCCTAYMEKYISYIVEYGREHNLPFEFQSGSALGAVKMGAYLPWDFDTDFVFECKDFDKWMEANAVLKPKGCHIVIVKRNLYMQMNCPYFFLELVCHSYNYTSHKYLPTEYKKIPTTIKYSNRTVVGSANPALHSRNRMGFEILKHAAHWRTLQISEEGKAKGGYDKPGSWNPCKNPNHHACLDHFPGDGNLPFLQPFLNL